GLIREVYHGLLRSFPSRGRTWHLGRRGQVAGRSQGRSLPPLVIGASVSMCTASGRAPTCAAPPLPGAGNPARMHGSSLPPPLHLPGENELGEGVFDGLARPGQLLLRRAAVPCEIPGVVDRRAEAVDAFPQVPRHARQGVESLFGIRPLERED